MPFGPFGPKSLAFVKEQGRGIRRETGDEMATRYLMRRLSMAVQRGNVAAMLGSLCHACNNDCMTVVFFSIRSVTNYFMFVCFVIEFFPMKDFLYDTHTHQIMNAQSTRVCFVHTFDKLMFFRRLIQNNGNVIQETTAYFELLHD